ncbi:MAG: peptidylprolyl isomerase [Proteobacteria bacterium]|nr:peptidylprolyl isomerase [Pseudomonadota bacterium]
MITKIILLIFAVLATSASSLLFNIKAQENYENLDRIVAVVEKDVVTKKELELEIRKITNQLKKRGESPPEEEKIIKLVLDKIIEKKIITQYAESKGIKIDRQFVDEVMNNMAKKNNMTINELKISIESDGLAFNQFREDVSFQILLNQIKESEITSKINVSKYEIDAFLKKSEDKNPRQYHIYHILVKTNKIDKIDKIINLLKTDPFESVAKDYSDSSLSSQGGDMGWKKFDELPIEFSDVIKEMNIGDISKPITLENGIHLLKIKEIKGGDLSENKILSKQYNISQIVIKANEITGEDDVIKKLENIKNQILSGLTFSEAAANFSEDASSFNGGNIGWIDTTAMLPEYRKSIELSKKGQVSGPYKTELGWALLFFLEEREKDITNERIRISAQIQLQRYKAETKFDDWLQSLKEQSNIEILLNE